MSEPKFKPGQFIKTPFGKMRVKKSNSEFSACMKCAIQDLNDCYKLSDMYNSTCVNLISRCGYLEKV